ncbi:transcription antitermination factor NusB [Curvibacter sp. CHRR-16]|uniref:transcription antitermination factor NusB n=1 Tax=Curvibacter sp. CHRR-16 TaxID=2835872 RepID=UPI001BDA41DF|nr:transcription antitermination factor NusB [Curvibacter sp. CHRR-16]MBT0568967.1 transcription antitermination factor NusB [Curvibacter sp. CHRR-16]
MSDNTKPSQLKSNGGRKASTKSPRTRAREFALQGLYQHLVGGQGLEVIDPFTRDLSGFNKADAAHFDALLHGCVEQSTTLDERLLPWLDRPMAEISPIEHAAMWIGVYEFLHCPDIPWRVIINESVELTKEFGGTDGHKYVNGVLNRAAQDIRSLEIAADKKSDKPA